MTLPFALLILAAYTSREALAEEWWTDMYVQENMNVRAKGEMGAKIIGKLKAGDKVRVGIRRGDWYTLYKPTETRQWADRMLGYGHASLLKGSLIYKVLRRMDNSSGGVTRMVYRVRFDGDEVPGAAQVKSAAREIFEKSGGKGWNEFSILFYLDGMELTGTSYGSARFVEGKLSSSRVNSTALIGTKWE